MSSSAGATTITFSYMYCFERFIKARRIGEFRFSENKRQKWDKGIERDEGKKPPPSSHTTMHIHSER